MGNSSSSEENKDNIKHDINLFYEDGGNLIDATYLFDEINKKIIILLGEYHVNYKNSDELYVKNIENLIKTDDRKWVVINEMHTSDPSNSTLGYLYIKEYTKNVDILRKDFLSNLLNEQANKIEQKISKQINLLFLVFLYFRADLKKCFANNSFNKLLENLFCTIIEFIKNNIIVSNRTLKKDSVYFLEKDLNIYNNELQLMYTQIPSEYKEKINQLIVNCIQQHDIVNILNIAKPEKISYPYDEIISINSDRVIKNINAIISELMTKLFVIESKITSISNNTVERDKIADSFRKLLYKNYNKNDDLDITIADLLNGDFPFEAFYDSDMPLIKGTRYPYLYDIMVLFTIQDDQIKSNNKIITCGHAHMNNIKSILTDIMNYKVIKDSVISQLYLNFDEKNLYDNYTKALEEFYSTITIKSEKWITQLHMNEIVSEVKKYLENNKEEMILKNTFQRKIASAYLKFRPYLYILYNNSKISKENQMKRLHDFHNSLNNLDMNNIIKEPYGDNMQGQTLITGGAIFGIYIKYIDIILYAICIILLVFIIFKIFNLITNKSECQKDTYFDLYKI